jgi:hypothetical protein
MNTKSLLLFVFLVIAGPLLQAQSKKSLEKDLKTCTADRDSLQKKFASVSEANVVLNKTMIGYKSMYLTIKERIVHHDFDPADASFIIDSLKINRNKEFSGMTLSLKDSLNGLIQENAKLKATVQNMIVIKNSRSLIIYDLKQLKELLDEKIINQEEFIEKKAKLLEKLQ